MTSGGNDFGARISRMLRFCSAEKVVEFRDGTLAVAVLSVATLVAESTLQPTSLLVRFEELEASSKGGSFRFKELLGFSTMSSSSSSLLQRSTTFTSVALFLLEVPLENTCDRLGDDGESFWNRLSFFA